jgi:hypothetical protein
MRISIWQAFSSNNSARFTVVGVFESVEKAEAAATRLRQLMRDIVEWLRLPANNPGGPPWVDAGDGPPSQAELSLAQDLGINWPDRTVDWAWMDEAGESPIRRVDHIVFVDGTESWMGAHPADHLIERLGGQALVDGIIDFDAQYERYGQDGSVYLTLTCLAPDEATAHGIAAEIEDYSRIAAANDGISFDTPWKDFAPGGGYLRLSSFQGTLDREGRRLAVRHGQFFHIADGFPAMLAFLQAKGCTDIEYTFSEERRSLEDV